MESERISYLDSFRGLAMCLVVFCHVLVFVFGIKDDWVAFRAANAIMLPMFFFVSGWFTKLHLKAMTLFRRLQYVLFPTVLMFIFFNVVCLHGFDHLLNSIHDEYKSGYWFPFALVVMNCIHAILSALLKKGNGLPLICVLWISAFWLVIIKILDNKCNDSQLIQWFSLGLISTYFPFYLLGLIASRGKDCFHKFITNKWIVMIELTFFLFLFFSKDIGWNRGMARGLFGLLLAYVLFYKNQNFFSPQNFVGNQLSMIGRYTLPIYLIHYFFLRLLDLKWISESIDIAWQPVAITLLAVIISFLIVYASLIVRYVISLSPILYRVLLGK